jgi:hypothetical protein
VKESQSRAFSDGEEEESAGVRYQIALDESVQVFIYKPDDAA